MKVDIYLNYCDVVFYDVIFDFKILICFIMVMKEIIQWEDGNEYLLVKVEIFLVLYLFYMGKYKVIDILGCIDKFQKCYVC